MNGKKTGINKGRNIPILPNINNEKILIHMISNNGLSHSDLIRADNPLIDIINSVY
jgi:hypothetical protein